MIRIRVRRIDADGYWGREPHPPVDLAGEGTLIGMTPIEDDGLFAYTVRMDDESVFDLVEHEFDVIGLTAGPLGIGGAGAPGGPVDGAPGAGPVGYTYQTGRAAGAPPAGWLAALITKIRRRPAR